MSHKETRNKVAQEFWCYSCHQVFTTLYESLERDMCNRCYEISGLTTEWPTSNTPTYGRLETPTPPLTPPLEEIPELLVLTCKYCPEEIVIAPYNAYVEVCDACISEGKDVDLAPLVQHEKRKRSLEDEESLPRKSRQLETGERLSSEYDVDNAEGDIQVAENADPDTKT